jgi:WD40 repeat protein
MLARARGLASHPGARTWLAPLTPALAPATDPLQQILTGHTGDVRSVAVTADGTTAVSANEREETVRVWNLITGQVWATLTGQDGTTAVTGADGKHDRRRLRIGEHDQHAGQFSIVL